MTERETYKEEIKAHTGDKNIGFIDLVSVIIRLYGSDNNPDSGGESIENDKYLLDYKLYDILSILLTKDMATSTRTLMNDMRHFDIIQFHYNTGEGKGHFTKK